NKKIKENSDSDILYKEKEWTKVKEKIINTEGDNYDLKRKIKSLETKIESENASKLSNCNQIALDAIKKVKEELRSVNNEKNICKDIISNLHEKVQDGKIESQLNATKIYKMNMDITKE
ncbi:unnamed protein product, partial [Meganyctiphanes norvegica]